ncbi:unnamed protein product [Amoebophrya sp. A25]|nr:unnamed protein product [Amoebophrya sp. A25]|eukprot:GSA25T00020769001.1
MSILSCNVPSVALLKSHFAHHFYHHDFLLVYKGYAVVANYWIPSSSQILDLVHIVNMGNELCTGSRKTEVERNSTSAPAGSQKSTGASAFFTFPPNANSLAGDPDADGRKTELLGKKIIGVDTIPPKIRVGTPSSSSLIAGLLSDRDRSLLHRKGVVSEESPDADQISLHKGEASVKSCPASFLEWYTRSEVDTSNLSRSGSQHVGQLLEILDEDEDIDNLFFASAKPDAFSDSFVLQGFYQDEDDTPDHALKIVEHGTNNRNQAVGGAGITGSTTVYQSVVTRDGILSTMYESVASGATSRVGRLGGADSSILAMNNYNANASTRSISKNTMTKNISPTSSLSLSSMMQSSRQGSFAASSSRSSEDLAGSDLIGQWSPTSTDVPSSGRTLDDPNSVTTSGSANTLFYNIYTDAEVDFGNGRVRDGASSAARTELQIAGPYGTVDDLYKCPPTKIAQPRSPLVGPAPRPRSEIEKLHQEHQRTRSSIMRKGSTSTSGRGNSTTANGTIIQKMSGKNGSAQHDQKILKIFDGTSRSRRRDGGIMKNDNTFHLDEDDSSILENYLAKLPTPTVCSAKNEAQELPKSLLSRSLDFSMTGTSRPESPLRQGKAYIAY